MKYAHDRDYESLWNMLEEQINQKSDDYDWEGSTTEDPRTQGSAFAKKEMCDDILDLMGTLLRKS